MIYHATSYSKFNTIMMFLGIVLISKIKNDFGKCIQRQPKSLYFFL